MRLGADNAGLILAFAQNSGTKSGDWPVVNTENEDSALFHNETFSHLSDNTRVAGFPKSRRNCWPAFL